MVAEQIDIVEKEKDAAIKILEKLGKWNMACPKPLFFQRNELRSFIRALYEEEAPHQQFPKEN